MKKLPNTLKGIAEEVQRRGEWNGQSDRVNLDWLLLEIKEAGIEVRIPKNPSI